MNGSNWWDIRHAYFFYGILFVIGLLAIRYVYLKVMRLRQVLAQGKTISQLAIQGQEDLQELELQFNNLLHSVKRYGIFSVHALNTVIKAKETRQGRTQDSGPDGNLIQSIHDSISIIELCHECTTYQGVELQLDMDQFTNQLGRQYLQGSDFSEDELVITNVIKKAQLPADIGVFLCLALGELMSNCIRHAFIGMSSPHFIQVTLGEERISPTQQQITLKVEDSGKGYEPTLGNTTKSNMRTINALAKALNAKLEFPQSAGLAVSLTVGLTSLPTNKPVIINVPIALDEALGLDRETH